MRVGRGTEIVIASHNPGKVREIRELLQPLGVVAIGAADAGLDEPEETEITFEANAVLKARAAADASGRMALADDSGLCVDALGGAPGVYSARWAGPEKDFRLAMARVERELGAKTAAAPNAKFVCALALAEPGGEVKTFVGEVNGQLTFPPRGDKGFGYDPIFIADGMHETFGEIAPATKHGMSHRARAFRKLVESRILPR